MVLLLDLNRVRGDLQRVDSTVSLRSIHFAPRGSDMIHVKEEYVYQLHADDDKK